MENGSGECGDDLNGHVCHARDYDNSTSPVCCGDCERIKHWFEVNYQYAGRREVMEAHRCPVCDGTGHVIQGFYYGHEAYSGTAKLFETCRSCWGTGVMWWGELKLVIRSGDVIETMEETK